MPIQFHKQKTDYSCGAAAFRMVLASLGIKKTENEAVKLLNTGPDHGTWFKDFVLASKKLGLKYEEHKNCRIADLKKYLKEGYQIIVCYFILNQNSDHYSVVKKIDSKNIYFFDPWHGPKHRYSLGHFRKIWKSRKRPDSAKKWLIAIKKNYG